MYWLLVGIFGGAILLACATFLFAPDSHMTPREKLQTISWLSCGLLLPAAFIAWMCVGFIEADNEGIRRRHFFGTRFVAWSDVSDYFKSSVRKGNAKASADIVTKSGTIQIDSDWTGNAAGFRALVQERAVAAKAKSWEHLGMRRDLDWPRSFSYNSADDRAAGVVLPICLVVHSGIWLWLLWQKIPQSLNDPMIGWTIATLFLGLLMPGLINVFGMIVLRARRRSRQFAADTITVSDASLSLTGSRCQIRIPWLDIANYYVDEKSGINAIGTGRCVVESSAGERIEFNGAIGEHRLLQAIIQREATSAKSTEWKNIQQDTENLDAGASKWTGGEVGHGTRIFHYRTRSNRALLTYLAVLLCSVFVRPLIGSLSLIDPVAFPVVYCAIVTLFLAWTHWRYHAGGIAINSFGITERTPFGDRAIEWSSIATVDVIGDDALKFGKITSESGRTIRFWLSISDLGDLKKETERRAPQVRDQWKT